MTTPMLSTAATTVSTDREAPIATLVVAFSADPVIRWIYPDPTRFLRHFPEAVLLLGGEAFVAGTDDRADGDGGTALWVPPGAPDYGDEVAELLVHTVDEDRHEDAFGFLAQVQEYHPTEPHWYLPFMGVDPSRQGRGLGSRLLVEGLARCDRDRLPAYLEASSPRNRALYERHGFEVIGEIQSADSPPLWPMVRPAV